MTTLFAHQERLRARAMLATRERPFRKVCAWSVGSGKTIGGMAAAFTKESSLFIVPKALKPRWQRDLERGAPSGHAWALLTKEEFRKAHRTIAAADAVVVDEAHAFSTPTSQMHKALDWYLTAHQPPVVLLMSATPSLSSPWSVYGVLRLCAFPVKWHAFRFLFFTQVKMGGRTVWLPKKTQLAVSDLARALAKVCDIVRIEDLVDVPEQIFETVKIPMPAKLKKAIAGIDEWVPLVRALREHQLCGDVELSGKLAHLLTYAVDSEKTLVICRYRAEQEALGEALRELYGDRVYQIHGDVVDRDGQVTAFNEPGKAVLLCNAACAQGWEAPTCGLVVFYSLDWSWLNYYQALGRVQRINNIKRNVYVTLTVEGSVDEDVHACVMAKRDFHESVYASDHRTSCSTTDGIV